MELTIAPKIRPLVNALNGIPGTRSGRAYEGHFGSSVGPFVEFDSPVATAALLASLLRATWEEKKLNYWWEISARFGAEGQLEFSLRSPRLDRNRGIWSRFQDLVLNRRLIDHDLETLANEIDNAGQNLKDLRQVLINEEKPQGDSDQSKQSGLKRLLTEGIACIASRALGRIRGNCSAANLACLQYCHSDALPLRMDFSAARIARSFVAVMILSATLAACGSRKEIQQDGTGTDEMLKSPCVCAPVPYQAPGYKWVS